MEKMFEMQNKAPKLNDTSGVGIIEIVLAVAVLGIVVAFSMSTTKDNFQARRNVSDKTGFQDFEAVVVPQMFARLGKYVTNEPAPFPQASIVGNCATKPDVPRNTFANLWNKFEAGGVKMALYQPIGSNGKLGNKIDQLAAARCANNSFKNGASLISKSNLYFCVSLTGNTNLLPTDHILRRGAAVVEINYGMKNIQDGKSVACANFTALGSVYRAAQLYYRIFWLANAGATGNEEVKTFTGEFHGPASP